MRILNRDEYHVIHLNIVLAKKQNMFNYNTLQEQFEKCIIKLHCISNWVSEQFYNCIHDNNQMMILPEKHAEML